jgi:transcription regulator MmyB-like protein
MIDSEAGSSHTSDVLRDLLGEIETLRLRRRQEVRDRPHPRLKRFTQQELTDEACPTYKNWLVGRSRRVPSRQTILQIAHYLECSARERNTLLLAARYLPETLELEGSQLKQALEQAHRLIGTLPYPAMLLTHTLEVQAINDLFQRVFEFPSLNAIPRGQRDLFHFVFHPNLPLRARGTFNDQEVKAWQTHASYCIHLFKHSNVLYQFEPWYQELVERLCALADFRTYWERDPETLDQKDPSSKAFLSRHATTGELLPIQLRHMYISVCSHRYPCIAAFFPLDEAARAVFASLGSAEEPGINAVGMH